MGLLSAIQIEGLNFASVGEDARLSDKASFYNCENIHIGNHCRIDDYCVISAGTGGIHIGDYIHVAVYSSLIGAGAIHLDDYCNLSSRVSIYSSNDDYSGRFMTNPMVPVEYTNVQHDDVRLQKHVIVGSGSIILPGAYLEEGVAIGALSLASKKYEAFNIYAGVPAKLIGKRDKNLLELEQRLLKVNQKRPIG